MISHASAQGIERESLSGETLAQQLLQSSVNQPYNLKLGPVTVRAEADATAQFNDNIGLTKTGRIADIILTPSATLHAKWQISDLNTLSLDLGLGYEIYTMHSQYNSLLLTPDSDAEFNFFVGDVAFNVFDQFSYQQDPTEIGQLSNTVRLQRWQNDVGITATWDLNEFVLSLTYDHANLWVSESVYDYLTNQSDTVSPRLTIKINPSLSTGLSVSFSDVRYEQSFQNDYTTVSAGPFVTATLSSNLSAQAQVGGYFSDYADGGGNGDSQSIESYYGSVGVNHRINQYINEALTAGREFLPGLTSNFTERIYATYTASWQANADINVGADLFWENLNDSDADVRETSNRYGVGTTVNYALSQHATLNFNYQFLIKEADPSYLSYLQNSATVGLRYQF